MHQYLFHIGDFPIRMYGLVLCMSIFLATGVAYFLAKQDGRWQQHILDIGIYGGFAGLIGGRLWDVFFFDWDYYQHHLLEIPFVWQGGMAIQGGVIAGVLAGIWYCKRHQKPMAPFLYGQPRFGKASWISLSSRSCFYSALLITPKGRPCVCM